MIVERYRDTDVATWDAFVRASRNGTFLFERGYMDYHRDRFADHSLIVRDAEGNIIAVLPAHVEVVASGSAVQGIASHKGLSYGGVLIGPAVKTPQFLRALEAILMNLRDTDFTTLDYKTIPHIYHRYPSEDDCYAMFLLDAELTRRDILSVVDRADRLPYQQRRIRGIKKARAASIRVQVETDFGAFWPLLSATLAERFRAEPVHSLEEIQLLRQRFSENIQLFTARSASGELLAGVVLYVSARVAHAQYIAASPAGRDVCALDLLFDHLLNDESLKARYFDFGSSHEHARRVINTGLIDQKEGFGARSITHDHYRIDLTKIREGILTGALR